MKYLLTTWVTIAVLSLRLAAPVAAGPFEDAVAAYGRSDYATAMRLLQPLADQGSATAQYDLGLMYENGRGVPQDYAAALSWYRKAADRGYVSAQLSLGFMYRTGLGVPQDYAAAVSWYLKAADQGYAPAQMELGVMYENGRGVPQDFVSAHLWFNLAAKGRRDAIATRRLNLVAAKMTPAQLAEAERRFAEWQPALPTGLPP
jgi:TPR repeat protein